MGGILTTAAVAETVSLTSGAAASASASGSVASALSSGVAALGETASAAGSYTLAIGSYTITAPVVALAACAVFVVSAVGWAYARRARGGAESQALLNARAYGSSMERGENLV